MMRNKISVVIPVYNGEAFIANAIDSVLQQTVKPIEIIVVNDGSRDGTAEKLAAFGDRIKLISIPNGGVSNARNTGLKACSGELVAFLDADDVWYEDKLERQVEVFERHPDVGFCCCDFDILEAKTNSTTTNFAKHKHTSGIIFDAPLPVPLAPLVCTNFVGTCSNVMIKNDVLEKIGLFNVNYKQAEDYDLWLRCALVTQFVLMSTVLLEKKSHETNLTNNFLETLLFHEKVLVDLPAISQAKAQLASIQNKYLSALASVRYDIGNLLYETGQRKRAFQYFVLGLGTVPTITNLKLFMYFCGRKIVRLMSFGLIKRKSA
jgi:glycosyltransferase involved in cell wall biosynthesis